MSSIYRVRPAKEKSIEEVQQHYLWFSRPTSYWDDEDANIFAFLNSNESIKDAFSRLFKNHNEVARLAGLSGICCFSESLPNSTILRDFPAANKGLVIEYDKEILENHFLCNYHIGNCFKKVEYLENPILFKSSSQYDILWERYGEDEFYRNLNDITTDEKAMDIFFLKMFTRINKKFDNQNELRIILGGSNVPDKSDEINGYRIEIPKEAIKRIYIHKEIKKDIRNGIETLGIEIMSLK